MKKNALRLPFSFYIAMLVFFCLAICNQAHAEELRKRQIQKTGNFIEKMGSIAPCQLRIFINYHDHNNCAYDGDQITAAVSGCDLDRVCQTEEEKEQWAYISIALASRQVHSGYVGAYSYVLANKITFSREFPAILAAKNCSSLLALIVNDVCREVIGAVESR